MMKYIPLIFVLFIAGCPLAPPQTVDTVAIGTSLTKAQENTNQVKKDVTTVQKHASPTDKISLNDALDKI
jgi:hypothetical protein